MDSKLLDNFSPDLPRPAVLCTIVRILGSAPQEIGAKMWVAQNRFLGTLGGGELEWRALAYARELLRGHAPPQLKEYVLCKDMGQCCGGRVEIFFEPISRRKSVHLLGAGHVGRALAQVLSGMPLEIFLIDGRPEWANPAGLPEDIRPVCLNPLTYARSRDFGQEDAACIFTHSHDLDYCLVKELLKQPIGYLGLIGSEHKSRVFQARLKSQGLEDSEELWEEKMHCPMGLPLDGKNPKIIAVSIAAQLLKNWALKTPDQNPALRRNSR